MCESTDHLGTHDLPPLRRGDLVAVRDAGAYAASLGSTYNGRPRPAQVLLEEDGSLRLVRRRGRVGGPGLTTLRSMARQSVTTALVVPRRAVLVAVVLALPGSSADRRRRPRRRPSRSIHDTAGLLDAGTIRTVTLVGDPDRGADRQPR